MILELSYDSAESLKWLFSIIIVALPWLILRLEMKGMIVILTIVWMLSIILLSSLYLGLLTYHYMGPQLGFNHLGNPMNWFLIIIGLMGTIPFALKSKNGNLEKPRRTAFLVGVAMLILIGPPIYNSVALGIYELGDGGWDGGEGDFSGEEYDPTEPEDWSQAGFVALFVCNLVPILIFATIWKLANPKEEKLETVL